MHDLLAPAIGSLLSALMLVGAAFLGRNAYDRIVAAAEREAARIRDAADAYYARHAGVACADRSRAALSLARAEGYRSGVGAALAAAGRLPRAPAAVEVVAGSTLRCGPPDAAAEAADPFAELDEPCSGVQPRNAWLPPPMGVSPVAYSPRPPGLESSRTTPTTPRST